MNNNSYISLQLMIYTVEQYIAMSKGVQIRIKPPENDGQLQLLGLAYDVAIARMGRGFDPF